LAACVAELEVGGGHHRERAVLEAKPVARLVLDTPGGEAAEARFDRLDRVGGREEPFDVGLREVERHPFGFLPPASLPA
jgi:hypothetical protein